MDIQYMHRRTWSPHTQNFEYQGKFEKKKNNGTQGKKS